MKILCIGEEWRGSNASGLFYAISRIGCQVQIVNELKFVNTAGSAFLTKGVNYLIRPLQIADFNQQLIAAAKYFKPQVILVYKGAFVEPETIMQWKRDGILTVNFFPDVSFLAHGKRIPSCVPLYDHIFSTKTFAAADLKKNFGILQEKVTFIPHGFDPLVHRKMRQVMEEFQCDVSFIGNYSPHKAEYLATLKSKYPDTLQIWGGTWKRLRGRELNNTIKGIAISGDLYASAINSSSVNLALLSEKVLGASSGDQITSRSFHIPGAGGFMLHERTDEIALYFVEGEEMGCFSGAEEMLDKLQYYLKHENERRKIQEKGHQRALRDHSLDERAGRVLRILNSKL